MFVVCQDVHVEKLSPWSCPVAGMLIISPDSSVRKAEGPPGCLSLSTGQGGTGAPPIRCLRVGSRRGGLRGVILRGGTEGLANEPGGHQEPPLPSPGVWETQTPPPDGGP